ncbi:hypothetical protein DSECCO2_197780 [anaerobic digester metagenome]
MARTYIHKLEQQCRNRGYTDIPLVLQKKYDRHNFEVGEDRCNRNKLREKIINRETKNILQWHK